MNGAFPEFAVPLFENAKNCSGGIETIDRIVAAKDERRRMPAIDVAKAASRNVIVSEEERRESRA